MKQKNISLLALVLFSSLPSVANDKSPQDHPLKSDIEQLIDDKGLAKPEAIEVGRINSCQAALISIIQNLAVVNDPGKTNILVNNSAASGIYEAYEFLIKHCQDSFVAGKI
ncbi:MAG: hypothetical protein WCE21_04880, partial [Candidatus Babeliales bacterium]